MHSQATGWHIDTTAFRVNLLAPALNAFLNEQNEWPDPPWASAQRSNRHPPSGFPTLMEPVGARIRE